MRYSDGECSVCLIGYISDYTCGNCLCQYCTACGKAISEEGPIGYLCSCDAPESRELNFDDDYDD